MQTGTAVDGNSVSDLLQSEFDLGGWRVFGDRNQLSRAGEIHSVEPMSMRLLLLLARKHPRTVSRDEIVETLWNGRIVTEDAISKQISKLRAALAHPEQKSLVATVPKVGIRLSEAPRPVSPARKAGRNRPLLFALVLVCTLVIVAAAAFLRTASDDRLTLVETPVTALPGSEVEPALSADGSALAYVARSGTGESFRLFVRSGGRRRIVATPPNVDARVPAWSDDGRLAFALRRGSRCVIAVGRPEAGYRMVAPCVAVEVGGLAWVDSRSLLVSDRGGVGQSYRLALLDLKTGRSRPLTHPGRGDIGDLHPVVATGGRHAYFLRGTTVGTAEIQRLDLASGRVVAVTRDGSAINGLALGPNGTLLLSSNRGGSFAVWTLNPDDGSWTYRLPGGAPQMTSAWNGRRLVYPRIQQQVNLRQVPIGGGDGESVGASTGSDWSPAFSARSGLLAFISDRSGTREIWTMAKASRELVQASRFGRLRAEDIAWSPDGRLLAASVSSAGQFDLYLCDMLTGAWRRLTSSTEDERQPAFEPNGAVLWFVRRSGSRYVLRGLDLAAGTEREILGNVWRALPTPDGAAIVFVRPFEAGLYLLDRRAGPPRRITSWPDVAGTRNFTVSGNSVWGIRRDSADAELMRFDLASKRSERVRALPDLARLSGLAVFDGSLIYARVEREESDLVELRFTDSP